MGADRALMRSNNTGVIPTGGIPDFAGLRSTDWYTGHYDALSVCGGSHAPFSHPQHSWNPQPPRMTTSPVTVTVENTACMKVSA